jgi:MFS transporter, DHA1 family, multidrug resistance protein
MEPVNTSWQRTLAACFVAELMAMIAFSFVDPLVPLYIQKIGGLTINQAAFWSGIAAGGLGLSMFFISPIWGLLADRIGRKPMVLRAMFGGAIVIFLLAVAPNIYMVIALRWAQGLISGTLVAVIALTGSVVPRNRMSFSLGILLLASFGGQSIGPLIGGAIADNFGYNTTFYASGTLLLIATAIIYFFVHEKFERTTRSQNTKIGDLLRLATSRQMLPLLTVMALINIGQAAIYPIIPLRVKELVTQDPATASGLTFSLIGLAAAISSVVGGRLGERINLKSILVFTSLVVGLLFIPLIFANSLVVLVVFLALTGLLRGALATSSNTMVGLSQEAGQQGIAYGLSASAGSVGNAVGPILGGGLASRVELRYTFGLAAGLFLLLGIVAAKWLRKSPVEKRSA